MLSGISYHNYSVQSNPIFIVNLYCLINSLSKRDLFKNSSRLSTNCFHYNSSCIIL